MVFKAPAWVRLYLCFPRSFASALHRSAELHHFRPNPLQDRPALIQYSRHVHCSNRSACPIGNHNVKPLPSHLLGLRTHLMLPDAHGRLAGCWRSWRPSHQSIGRPSYRSRSCSRSRSRVARNPATRRAAAGASAGASGQVTLRQAASPRLSDRLQAESGAALRDAYQVCSRIQFAAKGPLSAPCASHSRTGGARSTWSRSSQQARSGFRMT